MSLLRFGSVVVALVLAWAASAAQIEEPCKNHYILDQPCEDGIGRGAAVRMAKLYSTMDGVWQAIELDVDTSRGLPLRLGGRRLTFRDTHGNVRSRVLPATWDGPVRRSKLLLASRTADRMGVEYSLADLAFGYRAVPVEGGTVDIEGMDAWTFGPLPLDGRTALARDGTLVPAALDRYVRGMALSTLVWWDFVELGAREYYNADLDHYLVTANAAEIGLLEAGALPGWVRTGGAFGAFSRALVADAPSGSLPVCRLLLRYDGGYTHFMSSNPAECESVAHDPSATIEAPAVFYTAAPDPVTGACPDRLTYDVVSQSTGEPSRIISMEPMIPIYRFWNGKAQANHRFVDDRERGRMRARGWIPEGYGPDGVALCADWSNAPH